MRRLNRISRSTKPNHIVSTSTLYEHNQDASHDED